MESLSVTLGLKRMDFQNKYFTLTDTEEQTYRIYYKELILAYLRLHDTESGGEKGFMEPTLEEITEEMDGELILLDSGHCRWNLQTISSGRTAGAVLKELAVRAPYLLLGSQAWFDEEDEEVFNQAREMVELMRICVP